MSKLTVRPAELHDCCYLKDHLRDEHILEIWSFNQLTPEMALVSSYVVSSCRYTVILNDTVPIFMFGVTPDIDNTGMVWALGSKEVDMFKKECMALSFEWLPNIMEGYDMLFNFIDSRYKKGLIWAERLGAIIHDPIDIGYNGESFNKIEIRRK